MKFRKKRFRVGLFTLIEIMLAVAIIGFISMLAPPARVQAASSAYSPNFFAVITNCEGITLASNAVPTVFGVTNNPITIRPNNGLAFFFDVTGTNITCSNGVALFDVTYDGTHWTTTHPLQATFVLNNTTNSVSWTNFAGTTLNNARAVTLYSIASQSTNGVTVNHVTASYNNN